MTCRPILMSAPMVRALLDGTKTQTRRVVKPQPGQAVAMAYARPSGRFTWCLETGHGVSDGFSCPYGVAGDRLWVRETCVADERESDLVDGVRYLADDAFIPIANTKDAAALWINLNHYRADAAGVASGKPVPSIHMPRWASRITLNITDVRVERLNDISNEDAVAEGWPGPDETRKIRSFYPIAWYAHLWEQINGKGSWEANPWVWALTFEVVK